MNKIEKGWGDLSLHMTEIFYKIAQKLLEDPDDKKLWSSHHSRIVSLIKASLFYQYLHNCRQETTAHDTRTFIIRLSAIDQYLKNSDFKKFYTKKIQEFSLNNLEKERELVDSLKKSRRMTKEITKDFLITNIKNLPEYQKDAEIIPRFTALYIRKNSRRWYIAREICLTY